MIYSCITCSWAYFDSKDSFNFDIEANIEVRLYIENIEIGKLLKSDY